MIKGNDVFIHSNVEFTRPELVKIGNHVAIDSGFYCTTGLSIGDYVHISPQVVVIGGKKTSLTIEDFCFISTGSKLIGGSETFWGHGLVGPLIPDEFKDDQIVKPIVIKRFAGILANSVILPGVKMAEGSVLGANSLLNSDTEPWTIYAGNPAKPLRARLKHKCYEYAKKLGYTYE